MRMDIVPKISLRFDGRFNMEENWKVVVENVEECQKRGVLVTPLTVFGDEGNIIGWYLSGWVPPPPIIAYEVPPE